MGEARPIDRYRGCISDLKRLCKGFQSWSERLRLRHLLILWQGPGKPTRKIWREFLLEVAVFPVEAKTPGELVKFDFSGTSTCHGFRWQGREGSRVPPGKPQYVPGPFRHQDNILYYLKDLAR
jgi:hypothetical protein